MFIFNAQSLLEDMRSYMPDLYQSLMRIGDALHTESERHVMKKEFEQLESVSIDYGVMEKSDRIACLKPRFVWDDVGSWGSLLRHRSSDENGNIIEGNVVAVDSRDNDVAVAGRSRRGAVVDPGGEQIASLLAIRIAAIAGVPTA